MKYEFLSTEDLDFRCKAGEFYATDKPDNQSAADFRQRAIDSLTNLFETNHFVMVSEFVNLNRIIFVDIEFEGFCMSLIEKIGDWVGRLSRGHAVRCLVYNGSEPMGNFLVTSDIVLFEDSFRKVPFLYAEMGKKGSGKAPG